MSTSHVGFLSAIGESSRVCAVSGLPFVSDSVARLGAVEAGYGDAVDYERVLGTRPDLVVTYQVSQALPVHVKKFRSLGIPVIVVHEHLEEHPLSRAAYVRLFGALTGKMSEADSVFNVVSAGYCRIRDAVKACPEAVSKVKVLVNAPYGDVWYVPGTDSYFYRLVSDAGGEILGSREGVSESGTISVEKAFELSSKADVWLNPGSFSSRAELLGSNPLFPGFPIASGRIFNNTKRLTSAGGNDFYESGAARPDLILADLAEIFHPESFEGQLFYYLEY